jgi:uncharacterized alpha-E superfamily protein
MERSDCLLRVIRVNYILSFDTGISADSSWKEVIELFTQSSPEVAMEHSASEDAALKFLVTDIKNLNSIKVLINRARENARGVQDNITKEVWEQVNQQYHIVNDPALEKKITSSRSLELIDNLNQNSILFYGVTDSTMPRGQGWNFMNLGKFIERCILTIDNTQAQLRKIDYRLDQPQHILFWKNLLLSLSGYELYLKKYTRDQHNINVIDHIIFNRNFPRSLTYSLNRIKKYLHDVTEETGIEGSGLLLKNFGRICSRVEFSELPMIQQQGLQDFLQSLRRDLVDFSQHLTRVYFSYA